MTTAQRWVVTSFSAHGAGLIVRPALNLAAWSLAGSFDPASRCGRDVAVRRAGWLQRRPAGSITGAVGRNPAVACAHLFGGGLASLELRGRVRLPNRLGGQLPAASAPCHSSPSSVLVATSSSCCPNSPSNTAIGRRAAAQCHYHGCRYWAHRLHPVGRRHACGQLGFMLACRHSCPTPWFFASGHLPVKTTIRALGP